MTSPSIRRPRPLRTLACLLGLALAPLACGDATDVQLLEIDATGVLFGSAFLDLDGNGVPSPGDEPVANAEVVLASGSGEGVALNATTDSLGAFALFEVPVGTYRLALDSEVVGDSLEALGPGSSIAVEFGDTTRVNLGVTYPTRTIEEVLSEPVGRRVFTSGIALNQRLNFDPTGRVHFAGDSLFLRALDVERSALTVGDSVRLLGRVVLDNGRPALEAVTPQVVIPAAALPLPRQVDVSVAANADGGTLDAALVLLRNLEITDTSTNAEGDFRFYGVAGSDSVEIVVREFLRGTIDTDLIRPDTTLGLQRVTGLLTPVVDGSGAVRWQLLPRAPSDLLLFARTADVAVAIEIDPASASLGDTVEAVVTVTNGGPLAASDAGVELALPPALSLVSATPSVGSYDAGEGVWSVGAIAVGESESLTVLLEVTDAGPSAVGIAAASTGLTFEVDTEAGNDSASVLLVIS